MRLSRIDGVLTAAAAFRHDGGGVDAGWNRQELTTLDESQTQVGAEGYATGYPPRRETSSSRRPAKASEELHAASPTTDEGARCLRSLSGPQHKTLQKDGRKMGCSKHRLSGS